MSSPNSDARASNRDLWNKRVRAHLAHGLYPSRAVEHGDYEIGEPELSELGDVNGKRLLHLQCNAGADTLGWARRGAIVTGVDFSQVAIDEARRLAEAAGIEATFICSDVYDLDGRLGQFDIVYTSMGVLWWLPDLPRWASIVASLLRPGGRFYIYEIHPFAMTLSDQDGRFVVTEDYFGTGEPVVFASSGTYYETDSSFTAEEGLEHGWIHSLGDVISALATAGLCLEHLHEHPTAFFRMHPSLVRGEDGRWRPSTGPLLPLTFSLLATLPAKADKPANPGPVSETA